MFNQRSISHNDFQKEIDRNYYADYYAINAGGNSSAGATWSTTAAKDASRTGGSTAPTAADNLFIDDYSGAVTIDAALACRSLNCNGRTATLTHAAAVAVTIGDGTAGSGNVALDLGAGTYTLGNATTSSIVFVSTSATVQTVNFRDLTTGNVTFNATSGGSWQYTDGHVTGATATVTLTKGTLDINGQTCSWGLFVSSNSNTRAITLGTSIVTLIAGAGVPWSFTTTGLTFSGLNSTIVFGTATSSTQTFGGGGLSYGTLTYNVAGSTGELDIIGSNSFAAINFSDASNARSLKFTAETTTTIRNTNGFNVRGTSGKLMTVGSITGATHTLTSTQRQACDYLNLSYSVAGGTGKWYAGTNTTNSGNNTGWIYADPPVTSGGIGSTGIPNLQNLQSLRSL